MSYPFNPVFYKDIKDLWPLSGRHILGTFSDTSIVLYQAYKPSIATYAVAHQTFKNCPDFSETRMTWLKPNFLWMMFRSGWATKVNQERILAISIKREGFEEILCNSCQASRQHNQTDELMLEKGKTGRNENVNASASVRLQWDPDHDPFGEKVERRAIQLGIKGEILMKFLNEWIMRIDDVTDFVTAQYQLILSKNIDQLQVPEEKVYKISDTGLIEHICLD